MADFKLEAEDAISVTGYRVEQSGIASGDRLLSLVGNGDGEVGSATFAFRQASGVYDIVVGAFDESDGNARLVLERNGNTLGQVVLNQNPDGIGIARDTQVTRTIASGVSIARGDRLTLTGFENGEEHARFDFLQFVPSSQPASASAQSRVARATTPPRFLSRAVFQVDENQRVAADITARSANGDSESNGRLRYRVSGGADSQRFVIGGQTGRLYFKSAPDFETPTDRNRNNVYDVKVTATDFAGRRSVQDLAIRVQDRPESQPLPQPSQPPSGDGPVFQANQGQVVVDARSVQPRGDWARTTVQSRSSLVYTGPDSFSRVQPEQQINFRFRTDVGGKYFIALYGARNNSLVMPFGRDRGNDLFVGLENAETGEVLRRPTKFPTFFGQSNLEFRWGSTFSVSEELGPASVELEPNTEYRLTLTGRSTGYLFNRVTLNAGKALRNTDIPQSSTRAAGGANPAPQPEPRDTLFFEAEDAIFVDGNYRVEDSRFASGQKVLGLRGGNSRTERGRAFFRFNGSADGRYDLLLGTFDESDGVSEFVVRVRDGETGTLRQFAPVRLDAELGSANPVEQTAVVETVARGVFLSQGDTISVQGIENNGEGALLDFLQLNLA